MPMVNALGALGYGRFGYTTLITGTGWITGITGTDTIYPEASTGISIDSSENVIVTGKDQINSGTTYYRNILTKINKTPGTINYNRTLAVGAVDNSYDSCVVDSSDNIYCLGTNGALGLGTLVLTKYNSAGTLQWQRSINYQPVGTTYYTGIDIAIETGDSAVYIIANGTFGTSKTVHLVKVSSSGTVAWGRELYRTSHITDTELGVSLAFCNSNIHVSIDDITSGYIYLTSIDTSGTLNWQKQLGNNSATSGNSSLSTDGTNVCIVYSKSTNEVGCVIINNLGNIVRQHAVSSDGTVGVIGSYIDSDGYVYIMGQRIVSSIRSVVIYKLDNVGRVMFVNTLTMTTNGSDASLTPSGFTVYNNRMYISCSTASDMIICKFASNGIRPGKGYYGITLGTNAYILHYGVTTASVAYSSITASNGDLTFANWPFVGTTTAFLPGIPTFTAATLLL